MFPRKDAKISKIAELFAFTLCVVGALCERSFADSIQAAIAAAKPGQVIRISAGTYVGDLVLDKPVVLEGIGRPILHGSGNGSVITVLADGCTIRGFIVEHSGDDLQQEHSGILLRSNHNRVENNDLRDILYGIYLYHSQGNTIRRNRIVGRKDLDVGERGAGLHLWTSPNNVIEENVVNETRDGFYIQSSNGNKIRRNRILNLRYGIHYMFSDWNEFEENVFSHNLAGAAIMYSRNIQFRRNAFLHNRGFSSFGILFQECEKCLADGNYIVDNGTGVFMEALRDSVFHNNLIAENDVALEMFSSSTNNTFTGNNFVDNLSPLQLIGRQTTTIWHSEGRGNFWSDYGGYDLNGDGIGDVPHKIQNVFEYMEGNYPRLRLYLYSPAAQALEAAEKAFPLVRGSSEADFAPLVQAVAMEPPPRDGISPTSTPIPLSVISLAMFCAAATILYKGQHPAR